MMNEKCIQKLIKFNPLLATLSTMFETFTMIDKGAYPQFNYLILPAITMKFLPALISNCAYRKFKITFESVYTFLGGLMLGILFYKKRHLINYFSDVVYLLRVTSMYSLFYSMDQTSEICTCFFIRELTNIYIRKILFKKKAVIRSIEALDMLIVGVSFFIARYYELEFKYLLGALLAIPITRKILNFYLKRRVSITAVDTQVENKSLESENENEFSESRESLSPKKETPVTKKRGRPPKKSK